MIVWVTVVGLWFGLLFSPPWGTLIAILTARWIWEGWV